MNIDSDLEVLTRDSVVVPVPHDVILRYPNSPLYGALDLRKQNLSAQDVLPLDVESVDFISIIQHLKDQTSTYRIDPRLKEIMIGLSLTNDTLHVFECTFFDRARARLHSQAIRFERFLSGERVFSCESIDEYRYILDQGFVPIQLITRGSKRKRLEFISMFKSGIPIYLKQLFPPESMIYQTSQTYSGNCLCELIKSFLFQTPEYDPEMVGPGKFLGPGGGMGPLARNPAEEGVLLMANGFPITPEKLFSGDGLKFIKEMCKFLLNSHAYLHYKPNLELIKNVSTTISFNPPKIDPIKIRDLVWNCDDPFKPFKKYKLPRYDTYCIELYFLHPNDPVFENSF
ncbi:Hypothetical protein POVR1_LOCUS570 [uncultured virus]|nr:Hypothetical protein POVR1_LOCUS570 [uncultured virus]